jgi:enoyl-CoA hydratase
MTVDVQRAEITTVTIDRAAKLNALSYETIDALRDVLDDLEADPRVRAVILTGAGDRAFSAGADIGDLASSFDQGTAVSLREVVGRGQGLTRRIENFPKPLLVAVNGLAYGGGCEVVEAAHLAVASERATFAKPEISLGFPPPFGGSQRLPRHVGRKRGLEMVLTGRPISAARAHEMGLVNRVVPHTDLMGESRALLEAVLRHADSAIRSCLAAVTRGINVPIDEGLAVEAAWFASTVGDEAVREGVGTFLARHEVASERA